MRYLEIVYIPELVIDYKLANFEVICAKHNVIMKIMHSN
jgi:hypothetical protein